MREVFWIPLGRVGYREVLERQRRLHELRRLNKVPDLVLSLEHNPVITLGRSADPRHILADPLALEAAGVEVVTVERGGDVTYHGPGQLVLYPILNLRGWQRSIKWYIRALEEVMLKVAASYGIQAKRVPSRPGIWVGNEKLGAVGVYVRGWITMHGLALNVDLVPDGFRWIVPCGIHGAGTTSIATLVGREISMAEVSARVRAAFAEVFGVQVRVRDPTGLEVMAR